MGGQNLFVYQENSETDTTATGGGIELLAGEDGNKTIKWLMENNSWNSSEHFNIETNKEYRIGDTTVLKSGSLGDSIVSSKLTSVGILSDTNKYKKKAD